MRNIALLFTAVLALASAEAASAQTRVQPKPTVPTPAPVLQAPVAKPDLVIVNHQKVGPAAFKFYIKNQGAGASAKNDVKVENATSGGVGARQVAALQAGSGNWVLVTIWPNVKAGDVITLNADTYKKVGESDETNNAYRFTW